MNIYNDDCFKVFPKLKKNSIDLVLVDLPYAQTACKWDCLIDLKQMWKELKRCCKRNCVYVFFCTTKFGYKLIQSNERWFRYDLVWEKSRKVGFLSANKMPLRKHEMMYVFKEQQGTYNPQKTEGKPYIANRKSVGCYNYIPNKQTENKGDRHPTSILHIPEAPEEQEERRHEMMYVFSNDVNEEYNDLDNSRNLGLRAYAKQVKEYINKNIKEIDKAVGNQGIHHFYSFTSTQFSLPTEKTYNKLIEVYELDKMEGFRTLEDLKNEWEKPPKKTEPTYNSQKTEGKPYKTNGVNMTNSYYRGGKKEYKGEPINNKGDRHPTSILNIPEAPEEQEERQHEMMYIFSDTNSDDLDNSRNLGLRAYFKNVMEYIGKTLKQITKKVGRSAEHCFYINSTQFSLPTEKTYNKLIEIYKLDKMEGFRTLEDLKNEWDKKKKKKPTYNAQKTEGKPYKVKGHKLKDDSVYGSDEVPTQENKGDRHPTTIVKFNNPIKSLHRTQKPVALCEWLIKSYSNEEDLVLDFTMGSGTTGVACHNTNRKFIGVEKDKDIFKVAKKRLIFKCECGSKYSDKFKHIKTKKHLSYIESNDNNNK